MQRELRNSVIIITGASSGIGRATALLLGREGARLVLVARRRTLLDEIRSEIEKQGGTAICMELDLTRREDVRRMMEDTHARYGRIDVLINNAAFGYYGTVENTPQAVLDEMLDLNLAAPLYASQLAIPIMRAQRGGHIINISSVAGKRGLPLSGIYCATKFALDGLSQSMRLEVKDDGIDVSVINPGATHSEFAKSIRVGDVGGNFKAVGHVQSAEAVGQAIVRCIRRPKLEVYPFTGSQLVAWLNAIAPSLADIVMLRYFRERLRTRTEA